MYTKKSEFSAADCSEHYYKGIVLFKIYTTENSNISKSLNIIEPQKFFMPYQMDF